MSPDLYLWMMGRVAGLTCFTALSISLVTGVALRSGLFAGVTSNRAMRAAHEFTIILWIPLALLHVVAMVLDQTARVATWDLIIPFVSSYDDRGRLALGSGTLSLDLFILVALTGYLRGRLDARAWRWIHRLAYPGYAMLFLHAVLGGTDFSSPIVSALAWSTAFALAILSLGRVLWGRLPAR